jgi:DNA-binding beta-propeller fold protein YncE
MPENEPETNTAALGLRGRHSLIPRECRNPTVTEPRWVLVEEMGIEHRAGPERPRGGAALEYPVFAERAADGSTLIVDKLAIRKSVPHRCEYRSLCVAPDGELVADTARSGMDDGYGVAGDPALTLLRVTRWELATLSPAGAPLRVVDLSRISKRMPVLASRTREGTYVVAFGERVFDVELAEVDAQGRLLWFLPADPGLIGYPGSVQALANGNLLVADEFSHVVTEISRGGVPVRRLGAWGDPGRRGDHLSGPRGAWEGAGGRTLVADTRNDRVLEVGSRGRAELLGAAHGLAGPTFAAALSGGNVLVCDAGNRRVVELDGDGRVAWAYGAEPAHGRWFSFPRSVEPLDGGGLLVSDTAHDRVVTVENGRCAEVALDDGVELFWPRCARVLPSGSLLVADGRNSRVLEVGRGGELVREVGRLHGDGPPALEDPHDVHALPGGRLLVTDAPLGLVVEADWDGRVHRTIGGPDGLVRLDDPHSAQPLADGAVLVCDSGNDRLLWIAPEGDVVRELRELSSGPYRLRLRGPRHAELSPGVLVVADTANNRVLAADEDGELLWELSCVPGSPLEWLNQPRWVHLAAPNEVVVCDHYHHRVLRLRYEP